MLEATLDLTWPLNEVAKIMNNCSFLDNFIYENEWDFLYKLKRVFKDFKALNSTSRSALCHLAG